MAKIDYYISKIKIPTSVLFIAAIIIIVYFLPREGKYKYSYEDNRPWQYGLLTAPFKFHIHKSDAQIQEEKDSIMQTISPIIWQMRQSRKKQYLRLFRMPGQEVFPRII